jgi:transcriptional regulator with XRE-family HTH domain
VSERRPPGTLGDIIRRQRELAELPMRQLAAMVGISGPYLSQIERGLRAPSDQVLGAIAKSLQTSAEALQDQAEALAPPAEPSAVVAAIGADPDLTTRQRQALIDVYEAFTETTIVRRRRGRHAEGDEGPGPNDGPGPGEAGLS